MANDLDRLLSVYSQPVRSWPGDEALDEEALANYAAMNPAAPAKLRPDETFRGTFLPFRETVSGNHEWAVPGFLQDVWDAAKTVRDTSGTGIGGMIRPSQYPQDQFDQIIGHGMAGAMTGITGGLARTAIRPPAGTMDLGMFGGRRGDKGPQMSASDPYEIVPRGNGMYDVRVDGKFAGTASVAGDGEKPFLSAINIEPEFQRRGIGSALYESIEKDLGRPLVPSPLGLTDEATSFWQKRLRDMPPDKVAELLDEAMGIGRSYGIRDEHLAPRFAPLRPLPMDEPSRLARAREMGFDTDRTWYHGTSEPGLTELQPGRRDPGIWMTTDMMNASNYARGRDASLHYLRANPGKSFVVESASDLEFVPAHNGVPLGIDNNVDIVNHAFRNGYDSVHFPDGNFSESGNTLVVRRGNQVRDVDAAFDPAKSDSTNLLASHRIPLPISREDDTARAVDDILRLYGID